ncbi:MAG: hypothetical protein K8U57_09325 [Planctomycetes bacterium]|nr:hypothetical protein [Planctomycetota bacterium]
MSQNINDPIANTPAAPPASPPTPAPQPAQAGGLKQAVKIAIPILVLMGIIFAITFSSQYAPPPPDEIVTANKLKEPPLRFFTSARQWNPFGSPQDRAFPGFYEVQANAAGTPNGASFWFENRNDKSVTMQLKGVSCGQCSGGRVAPIPQDVTKQILQMTAVSSLPGGLFSGLPIGMVGPAANLSEDRLAWQSYTFRDHPKAEYKVPAGGNSDGWSPQWGILELRFSVGAIGPKTLSAEFNLQIDGTQQIGTAHFDIAFEGAEPFEISRSVIDVGELQETSPATTYDVLVYSSTRGKNGTGPGDLAVPQTDVQFPGRTGSDPVPFVSVSAPVRVPESELDEIPNKIQKAVRVETAYRMTITVTPRVGENRADLGPLERDVHISTADLRKTVRVKGMVRGGIWLDNNLKEIELNYKFPAGVPQKRVTVITDQSDRELVVVTDDPATPEGLKIALKKQPAVPDRAYYDLDISIPPGAKSGTWSGFVVLELKGTKPQRIRIPIKGNGTQ